MLSQGKNKKGREKTHIVNIRNEGENITTNVINTKEIMRE